jgi:hypothetical protein
VVADEDDERTIWASYVGERIGFAVYTFKGEVARLPTEGANVGCIEYHTVSSTSEAACLILLTPVVGCHGILYFPE